jgi:hypothetical protein
MTTRTRTIHRFGIFAMAVLVILTQLANAQQVPPTATQGRRPTVLFLCPHGAAKSVLASAYFARVAQDRGLNVRVEAAGIEQEAVWPWSRNTSAKGTSVPVTKPRVTKETSPARMSSSQ